MAHENNKPRYKEENEDSQSLIITFKVESGEVLYNLYCMYGHTLFSKQDPFSSPRKVRQNT